MEKNNRKGMLEAKGSLTILYFAGYWREGKAEEWPGSSPEEDVLSQDRVGAAS